VSDLPEPPVPVAVDLRDFTFMPLDVLRLRDSDLAAVADAEIFRASVISWCVAWHQLPAGSLPDDDAALARLLGYGRDVKGWQKLRAAGALRGWSRHGDGRLYHRVVAEKVTEAWKAKLAQRNRTAKARAVRLSQSLSQSDPPPVAEAVTTSKGQGQGQGQGTAAAGEGLDHALRIAIGERVLELAGIDPNGWMQGFALIDAWLAEGYDAEADIYPTIASVASRPGYTPPKSLKYFTEAIAEAWSKRMRDVPAALREGGPRFPDGRRWDDEGYGPDGFDRHNETRYSRALAQWIAAGRQGPAPQREDFPCTET
jgi:hypothetical protein